jgi:poly-gamma-glutamate capsule biosynthesis protein CapA/YwtB (metallophosphatase superfamily)
MWRLLIAVLFIPVSACTGDAAPSPGPGAPSPPDTVAAETTEPLVLAVHATHPAPRLTERLARRIVAGQVSTWRAVDGSGRPLHVVRRVSAMSRDSVAVVPASKVGPTVRTAYVAGVDPLRQPAAYPLRTPGQTPPRPTKVTVVGDVMLGRRVAGAAALRPLQRRLAAADLTLGNLESTLSQAGPPRQGDDSFGAPPSVLHGLGAAGFDAVSLANNHTGDYGEEALLDTAALLKGPVRSFGAGRSLREANRAFVTTVNGVRFGVLGFNAIGETPRATATSAGALSVRMPPRTGPLDAGDLAHVMRLVSRLDRRVDVVLVLPHWGTQYTHVPEPVQSLVGRRLVDAGADLVVGGHPHWVQGMEAYDGAVIAHSLGNFVFDMDFMAQTQQGVMLEATYWGPTLKRIDLVPYVIGPDFAPRTVKGVVAAGILDDVWRNSTGPFLRP